MGNARHYIAVMDNLIIDITKAMDGMTAHEVGNIKRKARSLYENLVCLQYKAEGREHE